MSIESSICSWAVPRIAPHRSINRSASVDFPWSMWAMMQKLRMRDWSMRG